MDQYFNSQRAVYFVLQFVTRQFQVFTAEICISICIFFLFFFFCQIETCVDIFWLFICLFSVLYNIFSSVFLIDCWRMPYYEKVFFLFLFDHLFILHG